ncbi:hypothetical protein QNH39_04700 [Neobacillus novalis]|uniref:Uncharacterized protein n=1 Tax=Neobacillus novalis TaxID=220687 RepID=A0AA95MNU5_9BACI|nr:hypothetical protein [Neobacillus novalis]WHY87166.1 hypothetical protein QNH39_04700 [Neobacillus novalis]
MYWSNNPELFVSQSANQTISEAEKAMGKIRSEKLKRIAEMINGFRFLSQNVNLQLKLYSKMYIKLHHNLCCGAFCLQ